MSFLDSTAEPIWYAGVCVRRGNAGYGVNIDGTGAILTLKVDFETC
jgi:hypothetical protein